MDYERERILQKMCAQARIRTMQTIHEANSGHIGGSLSVIEILIALYFEILRINPQDPLWEKRDRVVVSKGHCSPAVYNVLAMRGYFSQDALNKGFRKLGSIFSGHVELHVPGVDMSTGSLGQGLSVACGMALSAQISGCDWHTYAILGDGELQEGQVWEAFMAAGNLRLSNLTAIIDNNGVQLDGTCEQIMDFEPLGEKLLAFGWDIIHLDGHCIKSLVDTLAKVKYAKRPVAVIAHTVKGKGVSFMEGNHKWHGAQPDAQQYEQAMRELYATAAELEG